MSRTTTVDVKEILGDLSAPLGSKPWAMSVREEIRLCLDELHGEHERLCNYVRAFIEHQGWKQLEDRQGRAFASYESFCVEPKPWGLGRAREEIEAIILEREGKAKRQARAQETAAKVTKPLKPDGSNQFAFDENENHQQHSGGTGAVYRVARLRRDCPEAAERLERGEFKSVAAAERYARGEEPHPPRKAPTPLDVLRRAWAKASKAERDAFMDEVGKDGW